VADLFAFVRQAHFAFIFLHVTSLFMFDEAGRVISAPIFLQLCENAGGG